MSIQAETVSSGGSNGPGLSGLQPISGSAAAVSQSPGEPTAQHHHHAHDPYASTYPAYPSLAVPYNPAYNPEVNIPAYYAHNASQPSHAASDHPSAHEHASHGDQHTRSHASNQHEAMQSQDRTGVQQSHQELSHPEPRSLAAGRTDPRASVPYQDPSLQDQASGQSFAESLAGGSKRRYEATNGSQEDAQLPRKQRQRMSVSTSYTDTEMESTKEDSDVGPSGGPKHWTDEEKSRLFHWLLDSDERWEAFGTKMNTVFREGSTQLFNSRKSFTALKSCYHRNLEIFKQMYVFEAFLAEAAASSAQSETTGPIASTSTNGTISLEPSEVADCPVPPAFFSATERHVFLDRKLELAKTHNVPVSNLSVKVIDHWFDMEWFALFKRRFQEDPKTGLPVPRYAADREGDDDAEGEDVPDDPDHGAPGSTAGAAEARRRHLDPMSTLIPPPLPNPMANTRSTVSSHRSHRANTPSAPPTAGPSSTQPHHFQSTPHYSHSPQASPPIPYGYPHPPIPYYPGPAVVADYQSQHQHQQQQVHFQLQTAQSLSQLTDMTQNLLGTCNTLVDLLRTQAEDIKTQTELLRRQEERVEPVNRSPPGSASGSNAATSVLPEGTNKAAAATEVLANPRVTDDVKRAAADYLKRLFQ
ncbi:hypothetical protein PHLGIDRAFT_195715 [Phlebiopsis gigantea 11061_1 CR5-6]|uniref:Uncharacterized protein n=1 Tax=Phlebiopsis gigantea (strain 11061_1 CR5-6) TaxID=745531 RepID=A0A0C3RU30_PHLG1|nr:hypothetical protein PHLGIDRAFT_195715 [Phlebiopsis gigantea 11061_1 CR5-6]